MRRSPGSAEPVSPASPPPRWGLADARLTNRLALAFLLDVISIARNGRHLLDALLVSTISQANVSQISRQADLQVAFAAAEAAPPDHMRRPVSMNALATSLRLPFETTRRRVRGLMKSGLVTAVEGGVIVPTAVVTAPEYYTNAFRAYERLRAFYYQLRELQLLRDLPPASVNLGDGIAPLRTVARVSTDYVLRAVDGMMSALGDLLAAMILIEVIRSNTEHLDPGVRGADGFLPSDFVPDELRAPVSVTAIAQRLGLPIETVRRHSANLLERGLCIRVKGGLVAPAEALARPAMVAFSNDHIANLHRMFASFSQLGVLAIWDGLQPA